MTLAEPGDPEVGVTKRILRNRAQCLDCGDVIESKFRHDLTHCTCGATFVDGGLAYLRRGWLPTSKGLRELSIVEEAV